MSAEEETAAERFRRFGPQSTSAVDLLRIVLPGVDAVDVLREGKLDGVRHVTEGELIAKGGLSPDEALRVLAAMELGRRIAMAGKGPPRIVSSPDDAVAVFESIRHERKEHFCAAFLTAKNELIARRDIHVGTLTMSVVGPREVFREAIALGAAGIIVAHNHPSGDPTPSPEDIAMTHKLAEVGEMIDIPVLDHLILGHGRHISLKREGML